MLGTEDLQLQQVSSWRNTMRTCMQGVEQKHMLLDEYCLNFYNPKTILKTYKVPCILSQTKMNGIYLNRLIPKLYYDQNSSDHQKGQWSSWRSHFASWAKGRVPTLVVYVDIMVIIDVQVERQHGMHRNWYIQLSKCSFS